ncbi:YifB family Mg chelatase-like AAA ATPase [Corynebacterium sp. ZY180755]
MGLARTMTATIVGVEAQIVTVEANVGAGLPGTYIGGLADSAIKESVDRMKTATQNSSLAWPKTKVIVNLTPASVRKTGTQMDLAMCMAIIAAGNKETFGLLSRTLLLGEVGLDGSIRGTSGVLPSLLAARSQGIRFAVVPADNAAEVEIVEGIEVYVASSIEDTYLWLSGQPKLLRVSEHLDMWGKSADSLSGLSDDSHVLDMSDVVGQEDAKFAAEVAAAGGHNFMMIGPPGSGKSLIAERLPSILPELTKEEQLSVMAIHSVLGKAGSSFICDPPFVAPHHSVTKAALLGGGTVPVPGAVSKAHHGVLFLDEVSEINAQILDSLRMPLEQRCVRIVRSHRSVVFPAEFQLVLAANPCRCGAEEVMDCRCTPVVRQRYLSNLSGPLRDRIDIFVRTKSKGPLLNADGGESSQVIAARVAEARARALARWSAAGFGEVTNAAMNSHILRREFAPDDEGMAYLGALLSAGDLSQRGVDRAIKLSWTLADLDGATRPSLEHVARAYELREDPMVGNLVSSEEMSSLSLVENASEDVA